MAEIDALINALESGPSRMACLPIGARTGIGGSRNSWNRRSAQLHPRCRSVGIATPTCDPPSRALTRFSRQFAGRSNQARAENGKRRAENRRSETGMMARIAMSVAPFVPCSFL